MTNMDSNVVGHLMDLKESVGEMNAKLDGLAEAARDDRADHAQTKERVRQLERLSTRALGYIAGVVAVLGLLFTVLR